jgi:hypothetical protein
MTQNAKTPWHLWVVGVLSLLWNSGGAISYTTTKMGMLDSSAMPAEQIEYYYNFPAIASAFWAVGVWGCFLGSIALLLRKGWAVQLFGLSIIGLIGTTYFQWFATDLPESLTTAGHKGFAAAIWIITIALFFYAQRMRSAGVLR